LAPPPLSLLKHTDLCARDSLTYDISLGLLTLHASEAGDVELILLYTDVGVLLL